MKPCDPTPAGNDVAVASPARIYACYLRGTSHRPADAEVAAKILAAVPGARKLARANRVFAVRAAQLMARRGIGQFLDLGCGIATRTPRIHQVVRAIRPGASVLCVDNDPDVHRCNPAIGAGDGVNFLLADLRRPGLLAQAAEYNIDFTQPVGVLLTAVLHYLPWQEAYLRMLELAERMAPGSYLAISHITINNTDPAVQAAIETAYADATAPAVFRKRLEIDAFFQGFPLINPGLVEVAEWRANGRTTHAEPYALKFLGGVARKRLPQPAR